jgi:eukaryotic-like serine/threonine-protein kinase
MLRQVFFATELDRTRFQKEAEFTSLLDHPHIVPVYDVGEVDGQPYFAMKVIQGDNLADHIGEKALPTREAVALMIKVASAVHHAHQRGVLHRDLKPANILLDEEGKPCLTLKT